MGPTKTYKSQFEDPSSIRGTFGLTDTRNSTHGSGNFFPLIIFLFELNPFHSVYCETIKLNLLKQIPQDQR